jgi:hypothetical protein
VGLLLIDYLADLLVAYIPVPSAKTSRRWVLSLLWI